MVGEASVTASLVVTFPVPAAAGVGSRVVGSPPVVLSHGVVQWQVAHGWARVRGDMLSDSELMDIPGE